MSQRYRGMTSAGRANVSREFDRLVESVGVERASFSAGCGLGIADAKRLLSSPAGDRLSDHKPDAYLRDSAVASVLGISVDEFSQAVSSGAFPQPDSFTPNGLGVKFRSWRASTVASWLSSGCPGKKGEKNRWMASRVGA